MSPIKIKHSFLLMAIVALFSFMAAGCSTENKNAVFDGDSGKHPENWYTAHPAAFKADSNVCKECHGSDLHGGTSGLSCFSANFDGKACHAGGPAGHPDGWLPAGHKTAAIADINSCTVCHGSDYLGGIVNVSCTTCHLGGPFAVHPTAWSNVSVSHRNYVLLQGNATACANQFCHGVDYKGVINSGNSCIECHTETFYDCKSCHGYPPTTGKHVFHVTGQGKVCIDCHALAASTHDNGTLNIATSITYTFATKSCLPSCHDQETW